MKKLFLLFVLLISSFVTFGQSVKSDLIIDPNSKIIIEDDNVLKVEDNTFIVRYFDRIRYLSYDIVNDEIIKIRIKSYYDNEEELITDYNKIVESLLKNSLSYWEISDDVYIIYSARYEILITKNNIHTEIIFVDLANEQRELLNMKTN